METKLFMEAAKAALIPLFPALGKLCLISKLWQMKTLDVRLSTTGKELRKILSNYEFRSTGYKGKSFNLDEFTNSGDDFQNFRLKTKIYKTKK